MIASSTDFAPVHTTDPDENVSAVVCGFRILIVAAVNLEQLYSKKWMDLEYSSRLIFFPKLNVLTTLSICIGGVASSIFFRFL